MEEDEISKGIESVVADSIDTDDIIRDYYDRLQGRSRLREVITIAGESSMLPHATGGMVSESHNTLLSDLKNLQKHIKILETAFPTFSSWARKLVGILTYYSWSNRSERNEIEKIKNERKGYEYASRVLLSGAYTVERLRSEILDEQRHYDYPESRSYTTGCDLALEDYEALIITLDTALDTVSYTNVRKQEDTIKIQIKGKPEINEPLKRRIKIR